MTWYMVAVAAIEAAGIATAALLPTGPDGVAGGGLLVGIIAFYGGCLLPTWLVAGGARVVRTPRDRSATPPRPTGLMVSGALVMLLGSGPTLLAVGLAAELHGTRWVAGSALAFALGSLLAPVSVARLERRALPPLGHLARAGGGHGRRLGGRSLASRRAGGRPVPLRRVHERPGGDMDARVAAKGSPAASPPVWPRRPPAAPDTCPLS
ncbi:MAG TPA: hypothetical protein VGS14_03815 [Actinomycetes bacterium]|jgi:hypothetical protein|nr:hypothetical protein [Actinomycetes bacterium]